ncbi:hypothetical protein A2714_02240 [Candidatus Woesebacteria bacterium RIFCSPHIGHO2_01_FULL_38_9]|uniref:Uncharacterized protein n=2 Tax=Candidatus Woeseibacteriota TaxID=1752722 RepID=A0A1F7Y351_9BACT|nr:MAG: hypothetical protein A2714_02240 [Candidatus Woesebacteria bacterium RIFCSPHIGHO2_01_FULL_38_9]OGM60999.1 MAG: hypothetical protein A3A75_01950 [Candidatus Woesebacteria bacterium RIFCSPLOWO2_01_FULL_39_10]
MTREQFSDGLLIEDSGLQPQGKPKVEPRKGPLGGPFRSGDSTSMTIQVCAKCPWAGLKNSSVKVNNERPICTEETQRTCNL